MKHIFNVFFFFFQNRPTFSAPPAADDTTPPGSWSSTFRLFTDFASTPSCHNTDSRNSSSSRHSRQQPIFWAATTRETRACPEQPPTQAWFRRPPTLPHWQLPPQGFRLQPPSHLCRAWTRTLVFSGCPCPEVTLPFPDLPSTPETLSGPTLVTIFASSSSCR